MSRIRLAYNGVGRADLEACGETAAALEQFERPSAKVSDNRHGRQRTLADTHGRPVPGKRAATLVVRVCTWLRDEEAAGSNRATRTTKLEPLLMPPSLTWPGR
jgi:hypothetical protein